MSNRPDVSIIVPCYNAADTVHDTLTSLRMQTHPNWEAICVDDGSTDRTGDLLEFAATEDERVRVLRAPHGGLAAARNQAMPHLRADRVVCLDADDVLRPNGLELLLRAAREVGPNHIVAGGSEWLDRHARPLGVYRFPYVPRFTVEAVLRGCGLTVTTLIPRRLLGDAPFDPTIPVSEDTDLWLRLADRGVECFTLPRVVLGQRLRIDSLSHQCDRRFASARPVFERWARRLPDPDDRNDVLCCLACTCGAMAFAAGDGSAIRRYLGGLRIPPSPGPFDATIAGATYWGLLSVYGADGRTWGRHAGHWLPSVQRWLGEGPLRDHTVAVMAALGDLIDYTDGRWARVREFLTRRSDLQRVVVYGLGRNAAELLEYLRAQPDLCRWELAAADDHADQPLFSRHGLARDDPRRWRNWPEGTAVLVTPNQCDAMQETLMRAGGRPGEDYLCLGRVPQATGATR